MVVMCLGWCLGVLRPLVSGVAIVVLSGLIVGLAGGPVGGSVGGLGTAWANERIVSHPPCSSS